MDALYIFLAIDFFALSVGLVVFSSRLMES